MGGGGGQSEEKILSELSTPSPNLKDVIPPKIQNKQKFRVGGGGGERNTTIKTMGGGGRRTIAHSILLCMWKQLTLIEKKRSRNEHCQKRWQNSHPRPLPPSVIRACTVSNVLTEPSLASRPTLAHTCVVTIQWFLLSVMDGEGHARLWWYDR